MEERRRTKWCFLGVLVLALSVHLVGLFGTWHYDDVHTIVQNPHLDDPRSLSAFFHNKALCSSDPEAGMYRPLLFVSFALNRLWLGREPFGFLLGNLLIHVAVALVAFALARELARHAGSSRQRADLIASLVGGLYAVHPLLNEGVSYVSARSSTLATLCVLGAAFCAMRAALSAKMRWDWAVAAWLLAAAGCFTKEIAVMTPLLFAALAFPLMQREQRRACFVMLGGLFVVIALWLYVRSAVGGSGLPRVASVENGVDAFRGSGRSAWINLMTQVVVVTRYLGLFVWPAGLSIDHEARVVSSMADFGMVCALAFLLTLSVLALRAPRRRPLVAGGWLWFAFALAPTSSILPLNVLMNEHRLYLPAFGLFLLVATLLAPLLEKAMNTSRETQWMRRSVIAALLLLVVVAAGRTITRKLDFLTAERQWASAVAVSPGSPIARLGLGNELALRNDMLGACEQFEAVVAIDPRHDAGRINLAECLLRRFEQSEDRLALDRGVELLRVLAEQRRDSTLVALKAARAYQLRFLVSGVETDREQCDAYLRDVLARDPAHPGARDAGARFARERAAARGTAELDLNDARPRN